MNNSLKKIQAWRSRRQLRSLERWERMRAQGKARFVFGGALAYGLTMAGIIDVIDNVFDGGTQFSTLLYYAIVYPVMGIVMAHVIWWDMEAKYKNALIQARVKASPSGEFLPHDLSITNYADSESK